MFILLVIYVSHIPYSPQKPGRYETKKIGEITLKKA